MGNRSSTALGERRPDTLILAMRTLGVEGGGGAKFFGGARSDAAKEAAAKELREYESSLSAKAKERVIRGLAKALKRIGLSVDPDAEPEAIIAAMAAAIPRPRADGKGGQTFSADAEKQKTACAYIAQALNDEFTPGAARPEDRFIDVSLSPQEVCRQVGEWAHSFAAGVNTEFLGVTASVRNVLKNLQVVDEVMRALFQKITAQVDESGDSKLGRLVAPLEEVYRRAQTARQQQIQLLENLLNIQLPPDTKALELAMREQSEQHALVQRLELAPGSGEFSDTLAAAVSGLGTAASIAHRVNKALKKIGMSVGEYLASSSQAELQRALDAHFEQGDSKNRDLAEFLEAAETVRAAFVNARDARFREALEAADKTGGALDEKNSFSKQLESREAKKQVLVRSFSSQLNRAYGEMLAAIKALGPELGREVPLSDATERLNEALKRLIEHRDTSQRIELALIGIYSDAEARERKERFINAMGLVTRACADVAAEAKSVALTRLEEACRLVERTVDRFSGEVRSKFGGAPDATVGGDAAELLASAARSDLSLKEVVNTFLYLYYVARVRERMAHSAKELEEMGKNYSDLLGEAVGARLDTLAAKKAAVLAVIDKGSGTAPLTPPERTAAIKRWVVAEYETKAKFLNALQAVDLYLKAFTVGIAGDPDAVRNIKKMLDGTQVIARWFSDKTGDALWRAFEKMYSTVGGTPADGGNTAVLADKGGGHYYEKVGTYLSDHSNNPTFGIPLAGIPVAETPTVDRAGEAKKLVEEVFDEFQALKNLINAFARIGDSFGGQELRVKTFMSPAQIYRALTDYLKSSALSINAGDGAVAPVVLDLVASDIDSTIAAVKDTIPGWSVYFGSVRGEVGSYQVEDVLFVRAVKAMAAKILVTVGVYDMLERTRPIYDLTPTRVIVGGEEHDPEVITEAAELYFRLPRLVEYYHQLFGWDGAKPDVAAGKIALLPDSEGIFGGLLCAIFQRAASPESGDYSETELADIIREVSAVYKHFAQADKGRAIQAAVGALIAEVNQRYGVIKQQEAQDYWKMVRSARTGTYAAETTTNYQILPGEDDIEYARRAPSDRFRTAPAGLTAPPASRDGLTIEGYEAVRLLRDFRMRLDSDLGNAVACDNISFADVIRQAEAELEKVTDKSDRLAIASRLVLGGRKTSSEKILMFHETVITGLNTLSAITALLDQLDDTLARMDPVVIEGAIADALCKAGGGPVRNRGELIAAIRADAKYAGTSGGTIFDRYIAGAFETGNLYQRGGINGDVTNEAVFDLASKVIGASGSAHKAGKSGDTGPFPLPSQVSEENPAKRPDGLGTGDTDKTAERARFINAARLAARLLVRYDLIMRDLVETLFKLGGDPSGLVEVSVEPDTTPSIRVSFARLRSAVDTVLSSVKKHMELLRPHVPSTLIEKFEKSTTPGSVFWLEKNLIDKRLRSDDDKTKSLDGLARRAAQVYTNLTRITNVSLGPRITKTELAKGPAGAAGKRPAANDPSRTEAFGRAFAALLYYDAFEENDLIDSKSTASQITCDNIKANIHHNRLIKLISPSGRDDAADRKGTGDVYLQYRYNIYDSSKGFTRYRSVLFVLNQLIAKYLLTFTSAVGGEDKIYANLILPLANGVASPAVQSPYNRAFPDMAVGDKPFGARGDPVIGTEICSSLAAILRAMVNKQTAAPASAPRHLITQLLDAPLFMKETMRANLPYFAKMFRSLTRKIEFIRQLMNSTPVNLGLSRMDALTGGTAGVLIRRGVGALIDVKTQDLGTGALEALTPLATAGQDSATRRLYLNGLAASIGGMAQTLAAASEDVLRELGDRPIYFQESENSIEQFRVQTGKMPAMPLSMALFYFRDVASTPMTPPHLGYILGSTWDDSLCPPSHSYGDPEFKIAYGMRAVFTGGVPALSEFPFTSALLAQYNAASSAREQLKESDFQGYLARVIDCIRFVADVHQFRAMLSQDGGLFGERSLMGGPSHGIDPQGKHAPPAYALKQDVGPTDVLGVVEDIDPELAKKRVVAHLATAHAKGVGASRGRELERICNIIDMGVIPVNVHALMRGIPLANVLNYEFTFEQMAAAMLGERQCFAGAADAAISKTRQMFLALLADPFRPVPAPMYGSDVKGLGSSGFIQRIFRGDSGLGMGRPKFLSDQVFNKALFGSIYRSVDDVDEGGPAVSIGITRGRESQSSLELLIGILQRMARQISYTLDEWKAKILGSSTDWGTAKSSASGAAKKALFATAASWCRSPLVPRVNEWSDLVPECKFRADGTLYSTQVNALLTPLDGKAGSIIRLAADIADASATNENRADAGAKIVDELTKLKTSIWAAVSDDGKEMGQASTLASAAVRVPVSSGWLKNPVSSLGTEPSKLTYTAVDPTSGSTRIQEVFVGAHKAQLEAIGKYRFDTRLVRMLFFITSVHRLTRLQLNRELTQNRRVVQSAHFAVAPSTTEYGADPFRPDQILGTALPDGQAAFSD